MNKLSSSTDRVSIFPAVREVILCTIALTVMNLNAYTITGGMPSRFYQLDQNHYDSVTAAQTPGNDHSYYTKSSANGTCYGIRAIRQDSHLRCSIYDTLEAYCERVYYASKGGNCAITNALSSSANQYAETQTNRSIPIEGLNELLGILSSTDGCKMLIDLPNGITSNLVEHHWSSSAFDSFGNGFMPSFDWSNIRDVITNFSQCAIHFDHWGECSTIGYTNNVFDTLFGHVDIGNSYNGIHAPGFEAPAYFPHALKMFYPKALQTRGANNVNEDVADAFSTPIYRKLSLPLITMNQYLALKNRTIHIPFFQQSYRTGRKSITRRRSYKSNKTVSCNLLDGTASIGELNFGTSVTTNTEDNVLSPSGLIEISANDEPWYISGDVEGYYFTQAGSPDVTKVITSINKQLPPAPENAAITNELHFAIYLDGYAGSASRFVMEIGNDSFNWTESLPETCDLDVEASFDQTAKYSVTYSTGCDFNLGPTQPGNGCENLSSSNTLGMISNVIYSYDGIDGLTDNNGNYRYRGESYTPTRLKASTTSYSSKSILLYHLEQEYNSVLTYLSSICRYDDPIVVNDKAEVPEESIDVSGDPQITITCANSGMIRIIRLGESASYSVRFSGNDEYCQFPQNWASFNVDAKWDSDIPSNPEQNSSWAGLGKIAPITQVDWDWNNMKLN